MGVGVRDAHAGGGAPVRAKAPRSVTGVWGTREAITVVSTSPPLHLESYSYHTSPVGTAYAPLFSKFIKTFCNV